MSSAQVGAALFACLAGYGSHLVYTSFALRWTGIGPGPESNPTSLRRLVVRARGLSVRSLVVGLAGVATGFVLFGALVPALVGGALASVITAISARAEEGRRQERVADAWPSVLEEMRVLAGASGRPLPQALFLAGRRTPVGIRDGFAAAERGWQATTDFERALSVLKNELAEATSDVICETLLVAHQVGGSGVDRRLEALIEDRVRDLDLRRDARSRQAGARFARRFVLVVPVGMAFVGLSLGTGREAYQGRGAQVTVAIALALIAVCWAWAGRILRLPRPERMFT
jgi:tight adherence protein B